MCFSALLPLAAGVATSVIGNQMSQADAQSSAQHTADVRNQVLGGTTERNNALSKDATTIFNGRLGEVQPGAVQAQQGNLTATRQSALDNNLPTIDPNNMPGAADGSALVKSSIARALSEALDKSKETSAANAKLNGYGDLFLSQGLQDQNAGRYIDADTNAAKANNAILPQMQDIAANQNYQPLTGIGGVLSGIGNSVAAAAGAGKLTNSGFYG